MRRWRFDAFLGAGAALLLSGCFVYSSFQGARVLDEGDYSITPAGSTQFRAGSGKALLATNQLGAQFARGFQEGLNLTGRVELPMSQNILSRDFWGSKEGSFAYVEAGAKFGVWRDHVALGLPLGFFPGNDRWVPAWQIHPTLYLTAPGERVDGNLTAASIVFLGGGKSMLAVDAGAGWHVPGENLTVLPEFGLLFRPGESGRLWHFGVGASFRFAAERNAR
jgi:hypothetical protein